MFVQGAVLREAKSKEFMEHECFCSYNLHCVATSCLLDSPETNCEAGVTPGFGFGFGCRRRLAVKGLQYLTSSMSWVSMLTHSQDVSD